MTNPYLDPARYYRLLHISPEHIHQVGVRAVSLRQAIVLLREQALVEATDDSRFLIIGPNGAWVEMEVRIERTWAQVQR